MSKTSKTLSRRSFTRLAGLSRRRRAGHRRLRHRQPRPRRRVVVIGGGFGGATAAKYVRQIDPAIEVTLVEPSQTFITCPFSNYVLGRLQADRRHHPQLQRAAPTRTACTWCTTRAPAIDPGAKTVRLAGGRRCTYDRLIVSPGIDIRWGAIEGYDEAAAETDAACLEGRPADHCCCAASSRRCRTAAW